MEPTENWGDSEILPRWLDPSTDIRLSLTRRPQQGPSLPSWAMMSPT